MNLDPFDPSTSSDPDAAATAWAAITAGEFANYPTPTLAELTASEAGAELLDKDAAANRRSVLALREIIAHLLTQQERLAAQATSKIETHNLHMLPGGEQLWALKAAAGHYLNALLKRKLPLVAADVDQLVPADNAELYATPYYLATAGLVKQVENLAATDPAATGPIAARLADVLEQVYGSKKQVARLRMLTATDAPPAAGDLRFPDAAPPAEAAGDPRVMTFLKHRMGLLDDDDVEVEHVGPDRFPLRADSPLRAGHELLTRVMVAAAEAGMADRAAYRPDMSDEQRSKSEQDDERRRADVRAIWTEAKLDATTAQLVLDERRANHSVDPVPYGDESYLACAYATNLLAELPDRIKDRSAGERAADFDLTLADVVTSYNGGGLEWRAAVLAKHADDTPLTGGERFVAYLLRDKLIGVPPLGAMPPEVATLTRLIDGEGGVGVTLALKPGDVWADAVHRDLNGVSDKKRAAWLELLTHARDATGGKPSKAWLKAAGPRVKAVTPADLRRLTAGWFALAGAGRSVPVVKRGEWDTRTHTGLLDEGNADVLKGLAWMLAARGDADTTRSLAGLLLACVKKVPGVGPRCVKVANACIWGLGELATADDEDVRMAALGQLARLKAKVAFKTTLNAIGKAFDKAAEAAGVDVADLEELGVPDFGFVDGRRVETFGDAAGSLETDGSRVTLAWTNEKGKGVKSPPAAVKRDHADEVKELKQAAKDAEGVLAAAKSRLDGLYLAGKTWRLADFRERYLGHGLLAPLVRRLIWSVDGVAVLFGPDAATGLDGKAVDLGETAEVTLWHPIEAETAHVLAWRERLMGLGIQQPFKQAHREVYVLTDAERATGTYSNRFAAHVVKQHQFNALARGRGWDAPLWMMVDDEYPPPSRVLGEHGLRAEFWVEPVGDDYGSDTTDSGAYLHLATDQVRFHRHDAAANSQHAGGGGYHGQRHNQGPADAVPLADVPPLVLSEVLRDADLFVGVASVGNDPTWQDGGPAGRHREYWEHYSFGDLSQTAQTRKQVLETLLPRMKKLAAVARIDGRFLEVTGTRHTYAIHLGSGNIQIRSAADRYLCIVPSSAAKRGKGDEPMLPYEGDRTLSVILSKALMLAADDKITDPTILSQL